MAKNKFTQAQIERIQNSTVNQLGRMIQSGELTVKQLRSAYTQMRDIAQKRVKTLNKEKNISAYGKQNLYIENGEYFRKLKSITSESELIREVKDVSAFLRSKMSTILGLKAKKEKVLRSLEEQGIDTSNIDYPKYLEFLKWFKSSEFSKKLPSDSPTVKEVFENSPNGNEQDWSEAFKEYLKYADNTAPRRQY